jgi:hypothetical protein
MKQIKDIDLGNGVADKSMNQGFLKGEKLYPA